MGVSEVGLNIAVSIPLRKFRKDSQGEAQCGPRTVSIPLRKFRKNYMEYVDITEKGGFHPSKEV